jgi:hypothetical protein
MFNLNVSFVAADKWTQQKQSVSLNLGFLEQFFFFFLFLLLLSVAALIILLCQSCLSIKPSIKHFCNWETS